jgi:hypothetical protein
MEASLAKTFPGSSPINSAVFPFEIQATDTLRLSASDNREVDDLANSHEAIGSHPVSDYLARSSVVNVRITSKLR